MRTFEHRLSVASAPEDVWQFLLNESDYARWHPLFGWELRASSKSGRRRIALPLGAFRPSVTLEPTTVRPLRKVAWRSGAALSWLLDVEYYILLRPTYRGVRLSHGVILGGLLSEAVYQRHWAVLRRRLQEAGRLIKWQVEHRYRPPARGDSRLRAA